MTGDCLAGELLPWWGPVDHVPGNCDYRFLGFLPRGDSARRVAAGRGVAGVAFVPGCVRRIVHTGSVGGFNWVFADSDGNK